MTLKFRIGHISKIFLIQPSSAAAKHVFLQLNRFNDTQINSPEDYIKSSVMLQYNYN